LHLTASKALLDFPLLTVKILTVLISKLRQALKVCKDNLASNKFDTQEYEGEGVIAQSTSFSPSLESASNNLAGYRSVTRGQLSNCDTHGVLAYQNSSIRA